MPQRATAFSIGYVCLDGDNQPLSGDLANHTIYLGADLSARAEAANNQGGAGKHVEIGGGRYAILAAAGETDGLRIELTGESVTSGAKIVPVQVFSGPSEDSIWTHEDRTLSGRALVLGPAAQRSNRASRLKCFPNGTVAISRRVIDWEGEDLERAAVAGITYRIYEDTRAAAEIAAPADVETADVLFDEVKSDAWAADWNFRHVPPPFAAVGSFVVQYAIELTEGEPIVFDVHVDVAL